MGGIEPKTLTKNINNATLGNIILESFKEHVATMFIPEIYRFLNLVLLRRKEERL